MAKRIIAISGATGNQGGSVLRALAKVPNFEIRALTRNVNKPASKALLEHGNNIVLQTCDITSKSSLETALKGAYGFFAVTDYFAHKIVTKEDIKEEEEGKLMADVAKAVGVKHIVFSTLNEVKERSKGKWTNVHHFDGKHRIEQYIRSLGFETASFVAASCYVQNFLGGSTHKEEDGTVVFVLTFPSLDSRLPVCDVELDMGAAVKEIFELGHESNGKVYPLISEWLKAKDIAAVFEKATGRKARVDLLPKDAYIASLAPYLGEFVATDLYEMYYAFADIGFGEFGEPDALKNTEELGIHLHTWADYLKRTGWTGP